MQRADVMMVNDALDRLGESLLRNRMLAQSKDEADAGRAERRREFDTTNARADRALAAQEKYRADETAARGERAKAEQAHWGKLEEQARLGNTLRSVAAHSAKLKDSFAALGEQVRGGALTNEEASQYVLDSVESMPEEFRSQFTSRPEFQAIADGKVDWGKVSAPKPFADRQPADVETDVAASQLEQQAAKAADPAAKKILLDRAKSLRSGIGRQDPGAFIEENTVMERDDQGRPVRSQKRRIPAGDTGGAKAGKPLTLEQAKDFLKRAGGNKDKARELAKQAGYTF